MTSNLKNKLKDQIDGQTDDYRKIVIQNETQNFMDIFNKVFSEDENENEKTIDDIDEIDGIVEDILNAIVSRIKLILKQQFVRKLLEEEEDGENEISSEKET